MFYTDTQQPECVVVFNKIAAPSHTHTNNSTRITIIIGTAENKNDDDDDDDIKMTKTKQKFIQEKYLFKKNSRDN